MLGVSANIDQNATEQPSKELYTVAATNGVVSPTEYNYNEASTDVVVDGSPDYSLPMNGPVVDASFMAGYYTPTYVTYPTPAAVHSSSQEISWSAAATCDPASSYYAAAGYMSPTGTVYDYSAHTATSSYGWLPGDYSAAATAWGMASPTYATAGDGYYHTASIESYSNGELVDYNTAAVGGGGDAQVNLLEQSVKAMGLGENGYCDGLLVDQKIPASWAAVLPLTGHSGHHAGQMTGYRNKRTSVGINRAMIDSSGVWTTGPGGYRNQQLVSYRGMATATSGGLAVKKSNMLVEKLQAEHQYNPKEFDLNLMNARFFVIKSYSEDDIHRSIKYGIWCSTDYGNKRLDAAFRELDGKASLFLLYSVNGSGHFCGVAEMTSPVDYLKSAAFWAQDKWKGQFTVRWIYVKDVPNSQLRHIRLENNEGKPVTNSRDTQEVPPDKGKLVLNIIHNYQHTTSIFDDFLHYEQRQEECVNVDATVVMPAAGTTCVSAAVSSIESGGSQQS